MTNEEVICSFLAETKSGTVTVGNWTMASDGAKYLYFWAERWMIITDKLIAGTIKGFKSSERWQLAAIDNNGALLALFPGCQVKAFVSGNKPPSRECGCFE